MPRVRFGSPPSCIDPCRDIILKQSVSCCFNGTEKWTCTTMPDNDSTEVEMLPVYPMSRQAIGEKYNKLTLTDFCRVVGENLNMHLIGNPAVHPFEGWKK